MNIKLHIVDWLECGKKLFWRWFWSWEVRNQVHTNFWVLSNLFSVRRQFSQGNNWVKALNKKFTIKYQKKRTYVLKKQLNTYKVTVSYVVSAVLFFFIKCKKNCLFFSAFEYHFSFFVIIIAIIIPTTVMIIIFTVIISIILLLSLSSPHYIINWLLLSLLYFSQLSQELHNNFWICSLQFAAVIPTTVSHLVPL